jgi:hypothetical protein
MRCWSPGSTVVAPEYGNFAKPLKIGPIYDICDAAGATARTGGWAGLALMETRDPPQVVGRNRFIAPLGEAEGVAHFGEADGAIKRLRPTKSDYYGSSDAT